MILELKLCAFSAEGELGFLVKVLARGFRVSGLGFRVLGFGN